MKLYRLIDDLFETEKQRHGWLGLYCALYLLFQTVWNVLILIRIVSLKDYDALLALQSDLSMYSSSLFIRIVIELITLPSVSLTWILRALLSCLNVYDILFFLALFLYGIYRKCRRKVNGLLLAYGFPLVILMISVIIGRGASSLGQVISLLKTASVFCLACEVILTILCVRVISASIIEISGFSNEK